MKFLICGKKQPEFDSSDIIVVYFTMEGNKFIMMVPKKVQSSSSWSLNEVQAAAKVIWRKLCWKLARIVASDSHRKRRQVGLVPGQREMGV